MRGLLLVQRDLPFVVSWKGVGVMNDLHNADQFSPVLTGTWDGATNW